MDSGLARLGVPIEEAEGFVKSIARLPNVLVEGLFTHLPFGDAAGLDWARPRLERFDQLIGRLKRSGMEIPVTQSLASSGVACRGANRLQHGLHGPSLVRRPGLRDPGPGRLVPLPSGAEGGEITPDPHRSSPDRQGDRVGGPPVLKGGSVTGVVPFGLYDGYRPAVSGETAMMLVRGRRVPVLYVTQEYTTLDLSEVADVGLGEEVTALGKDGREDLTIEEMARWFGGIPLNVLMSLNERLPYRYLGEAGEKAPRTMCTRWRARD